MRVELGSVFTEDFLLESNAPLATVTRTIVVGSTTSGALSFTSQDRLDFLGLILDDVLLEQRSAVVIPEPSTMLLLGSGLAGLGFFRRRRKREA